MPRLFLSYFQDVSLKWKLFIVNMLIFTALVMATTRLGYHVALEQLDSQQRLIMDQSLHQSSKLIDTHLEIYARNADIIFYNTNIQKLLETKYDTLVEIVTAQSQMQRELEPVLQELVYNSTRLKSQGNAPVQLIIYSNNITLAREGGLIENLNKVIHEEWVDALYRSETGTYWRGSFVINNERYISVSRQLRSFQNLKPLGILSILIPEAKITGLLSQTNYRISGTMFLLNPSDPETQIPHTSVFNSHSIFPLLEDATNITGELIDITIDGKHLLLACNPSSVTGWQFVALMPYTIVTDSLNSFTYATTFILVVGMLICVILTLFVAHMMSLRLNNFTHKINRLKTSWVEPLPRIEGKDEVGQLDNSFNELIKELHAINEQRLKLHLQRASLQVELLQAQINPHLLYNTLATLNWKAKKMGAVEISAVTTALIRFFRHSLNKGQVVSSYGREIELVRENITILKFTYDFDFDWSVSIDPAIVDCEVLHLSLQPIVENAIVHGIRPSKRRGKLEIKGQIESGQIVFSICDNGIGIPAFQVEQLNGNMNNEAMSNSYGLMNVKKRILLHCGESYGVFISSIEGHGTQVNVILPISTQTKFGESGVEKPIDKSG